MATFTIKTSMGDITVRLYDDTPLHRDNFTKLVNEKYYDGIRFHRVIEGFMIQTGDPLSRFEEKRAMHGTGGPSERIPAEIKHPNKRGTLAAARDNNPQRASSGSQFYINQIDNDYLDGQYTVFGVVESGIEVVDEIGGVATDMNDNPITPVLIETIVVAEAK